jgi:hypothetical protein
MADDKRIYFGSLEHQQQLGVSKVSESHNLVTIL